MKLRGSWRGDYREGEPEPPVGIPEMPPDFAKPGAEKYAEMWARITRELDVTGVLTVNDWPQLERWVRFFVRWRMIEESIQTLNSTGDQMTLYSEDSLAKLATRLNYQSRCLDASLKQVERNFGLTPADRARLAQYGKEPVDDSQDDERFFGTA